MKRKELLLHLIFLSFVLFLSCKNSGKKEKASNYNYDLEINTSNDLKIPINEDTEYRFPSLFPYMDKSGKEYLTFMSHMNNAILFYDLLTGEYLFKVEFEKEGPDGVGIMHGYHIEDFNNIYITSHLMGLSKADTSGTKKQFIEYGETNNGHRVVPNFTSSSYIYAPAVIYDGKIFITQRPYQDLKASKTPVSVSIDTTTMAFEELPFRYPNIIPDEKRKETTISVHFSREFDGKQFIYSFHMDEKIYTTGIETNDEKIIYAPSKYIKNMDFVKYADDREKVYKQLLETSYYYNILYDKYRKVYYRFAIIGSEISKNPDYSFFDIYTNGFIAFSVIILDENFNIIGETLFPKYTYNPTIAFVHKNGLYISDSHILNPSFDENTLSFKCFTLKEKR